MKNKLSHRKERREHPPQIGVGIFLITLGIALLIATVEAQDDYVMIHHGNGKALKQQTMKYYEDNLPKKDFVRIHRSYIVRVQEIKRIEPYGKDNHIAFLTSGDKLPVSRAGYKLLKEELDF